MFIHFQCQKVSAGQDYGAIQPGSCPGRQPEKKVSRRKWNNPKYGTSKLRFPHAKEFLRKLSANLFTRPLQFRQPCLRPKNLKNVVLKGRQIISLPGAPTRPVPSMSIGEMKVPLFTKYKTNIRIFKHTSLNNRKTKDMFQENPLILFF